LFVASAKTEPEGRAALEQKLSMAQALVREGKLPFSPEAFEGALEEWRALGYPAIHHSKAFRAAYAPAYRVISNEYLPFLPLFANIDTMLKTTNVVLAIEGGSASGKTTLSETLKMLYDCTVFHMDDFFLRPEQRTKERYAQVGGNVDRERFLAQVLLPLSRRQPVAYQRFDCSTMTLMPAQTVTPTKLTVIEGAYSMHPELAPYYHASVFLNVSPDVQRERIKKRNSPAMAERFFGEWIPLEERYFSQMQVAARCDMVIDIV
jgi:thymidylate kinase